MNDNEKMRRYFEVKLEETPDQGPPAGRIRSIANNVALQPASRWETLFGLMVTFMYLSYLLNPMNWFSLGRFMLAFMNGLSLSRFVFVFNVGF